MWMKLSDIKIPKNFAETTPRQAKMETCRKNWELYETQDRPIVVNNANYLVDGYIQYLILKEKCIAEAKVIIANKKKSCWRRKTKPLEKPSYKTNPTTYVFGKHVGNASDKEYVWRVPGKWIEWEYLHSVGDEIFVHTKYGKKLVKITRIEEHSICPVDYMVRPVCKNRLLELEENA